MTWFGWLLTFIFALSVLSPLSDNKTKTIALLTILGILTVGTGTGL